MKTNRIWFKTFFNYENNLNCEHKIIQGNENYYYWDTVSSSCKIKGGLGYPCACPTISKSNSQCNTTLNLACYTSSGKINLKL